MEHQPANSLPLVLTDSPVNDHDILEDEVELGFRFGQTTILNPHLKIDRSRFSEYLAHAVAASPADLLRHTQRIYYFYNNYESEGIYSSLLDLFLALGPSGRPLRHRMLMGTRDRLLPEHYQILARWLRENKPCPDHQLPLPTESLLHQGVTGIRELVRVQEFDKPPERDPLQEAREHIEYFQLEEARDLLEAAIFENPGRLALQQELIHLYQATRDYDRLREMREKLSQIMNELPDFWLNSSYDQSPQAEGYNL